MEINQPLDADAIQDLQLSGSARAFLKETAGWARFLAIVGFIFIALFVVIALAAGAIMNTFTDELGLPGFLVTVIYLVLAALYFFPVLYLFRFATKMKSALANNFQSDLDSSLSNLKSLYKYWGIMMIVILAFYGLAFAGGMIAGFMAA